MKETEKRPRGRAALERGMQLEERTLSALRKYIAAHGVTGDDQLYQIGERAYWTMEDPTHSDICVQFTLTCNRFGRTTHREQLQAMSNAEFARWLIEQCEVDSAGFSSVFCRGSEDCDAYLDREEAIPLERCVDCLARWLGEVAEG